MTNAEARFNNSLRPRKPEGSLGRTAQDGHLDSHTAPELCSSIRRFLLGIYNLPVGITRPSAVRPCNMNSEQSSCDLGTVAVLLTGAGRGGGGGLGTFREVMLKMYGGPSRKTLFSVSRGCRVSFVAQTLLLIVLIVDSAA